MYSGVRPRRKGSQQKYIYDHDRIYSGLSSEGVDIVILNDSQGIGSKLIDLVWVKKIWFCRFLHSRGRCLWRLEDPKWGQAYLGNHLPTKPMSWFVGSSLQYPNQTRYALSWAATWWDPGQRDWFQIAGLINWLFELVVSSVEPYHYTGDRDWNIWLIELGFNLLYRRGRSNIRSM